MNPILWRVATYSVPGFPRPATKRIRFSSTAVNRKIPKTCPERSEAESNGSKIENGLLLLLLLLGSFFLRSRSGRRSSFALFLFLGNHFRSGRHCFRLGDYRFFLN